MPTILNRVRAVCGWWLFGLAVWMAGCIDPFDAGRATGSEYLVVDAAFDNTATGRSLKLTKTSQPFGFPTSTPIVDAQVQLQAVGGRTAALTPNAGGSYTVPADWQFVPGTTYKLLIRVTGRQYESGAETMPDVVPIRQIYRSYNPTGYKLNVAANTTAPAQNLLVDFQDPGGQVNFYQWTYLVWERQTTCATCENSLYNNQTNTCVPAATNSVFDYGCIGDCWQIVRSGPINVATDALFDGKLLTGRQAGVLPYYSRTPCLVSLRQRSLSPGAYRYAVILADQSQNTGGLADTPPAGLGGNVRNVTDAAETVLGYFSVSGVAEMLYWNDRTDVPASATPIGLLGGRRFNPEPSNVYGILRPPLAPCTPTDSQTPIKPVGWQN